MDSNADDFCGAPAAGVEVGHSPLQFVTGEFQRPKTPLLYRLSLLFVSCAMILLPVVYFGIILLFGAGIYYYGAHFQPALDWQANRGWEVILTLILYAGPLVVGVGFIFFLIKPIFAPRPEVPEPISLNHADAPQLFAFIGWICQSLRAPIPSRIDVNLSVNAAASFRGGAKSILGNDIVLVIGLPLVAGLNLSQFAGIIAHEYGHFSQGAGMRAGYLIRQINGWFYRVVCERDRWDNELTALSEQEDQSWLIISLLYLARLGIWFGRGILGVLMLVGHALSSWLARQMELDADRYEINLCGTESFIAGARRVQQLNLGAAAAERQLIQQWKGERKLFDQLPMFITRCANEIPAEEQGKVHAASSKRKAHLFDSHPSDAERIERAIAANEPGVFHATGPASGLFADFEGLCRRTTLAHYREMVGETFATEMLLSTQAAVQAAEHDYAADEAVIEQFFYGVATSLRPIIIAENKEKSVQHADALMASLRANREMMEKLLPVAQAALEQLTGADGSFLKIAQAEGLLDAGVQFEAEDFDLDDGNVEQAQEKILQALDTAGAQLRRFEEAGRGRLMDAVQLLRLLEFPHVEQLREESRQMIWVLSRLEIIFEPLLELRRDCAALEILLHYRQRQAAADNVNATLENLCADAQEKINFIQEHTAQLRYPFPHAAGQIFVNDYARNTEYNPEPLQLTLLEGKSHLAKLTDLYHRLLGRLVMICERVEEYID